MNFSLDFFYHHGFSQNLSSCEELTVLDEWYINTLELRGVRSNTYRHVEIEVDEQTTGTTF